MKRKSDSIDVTYLKIQHFYPFSCCKYCNLLKTYSFRGWVENNSSPWKLWTKILKSNFCISLPTKKKNEAHTSEIESIRFHLVITVLEYEGVPSYLGAHKHSHPSLTDSVSSITSVVSLSASSSSPLLFLITGKLHSWFDHYSLSTFNILTLRD